MAQSDVIQGELDTFYKGQKNPLDLYNEASASLGIPEIRTRVKGLRTTLTDTENLLNKVEGSVKGRTAGSLVTEAQRQRLTALEREPLTKQYGEFAGQLNNESANLSDLLGQATNTTNLTLQGYAQSKGDMIQRLGTAKEKEAEARRQAEWAAQQAQWEKQFKESQRQFNVSQANTTRNNSNATANAFNADLAAAISNPGQYIDLNNKKAPSTREALINGLYQKYGSSLGMSKADIGAAVYANIRGGWEGAYNHSNFMRDVKSGAWK